MELKTTNVIVDNVYKITFETQDFSSSEDSLITKYGEPVVQMGGTFTVSGESYTMTSSEKKIKTDFPQTVSFDTRDSASAMLHAINYESVIYSRMIEAMNNLRVNLDGFSGETTRNI